jgi:hypothetical protein
MKRIFNLFKKAAESFKKLLGLKYLPLAAGLVAGAVTVKVLGPKAVMGGAAAAFSILLFILKWGISLVVLYSLLWFLFSALTFIASKGKAPAFQMTTAMVLGVMTAICHALIYLLWWR